MVILMDASSSVNDDDWALQIDFAAQLVERFDVSIDKTRIGFVIFATEYVALFFFWQ